MKKRVYIADDDDFFVDVTREMLVQTSQDTDIVSFPNGAALLSSLRMAQVPPDLIILDLNMPDYSGLETLKAIKLGRNPDIPVIILSSNKNKHLIDACYANDASIFIAKPNESTSLNEIVGTISLILKYIEPKNSFSSLF